MLLIVIALAAFAVIYLRCFPIPLPAAESNVKLAGFVNDQGLAVLQHVGGETIQTYDVWVTQSDGRHIYHYTNESWEMGQFLYPPLNQALFLEEHIVNITVLGYTSDGATQIIFEGTLRPKEVIPGPPQIIPDAMLVSTLRTNTYDEDLICYSYLIHPTITPKTFIYSWMINNSGTYIPFARLLLPFDTQSSYMTTDYSGHHQNGTINGPSWTSNGRVGGAYQYAGHDFISIPYCFSSPTVNLVTVEAWVKTSQASGTIVSYNRSNYCELALTSGYVKWSTTSTDGTIDLIGSTPVNDSTWHLIVATYNGTSGYARIYLDGKPEKTAQTHVANSPLGTGNSPLGKIGEGVSIASRRTMFSTGFETVDEKNAWNEENSTGGQPITWTKLKYDSFETGMGNYTIGGSYCSRVKSTPHSGSYSVQAYNHMGTSSSFSLTNGIDCDSTAYKSIKVDFWWESIGSWTSSDDWWLLYYNGTTWQTVLDMHPYTKLNVYNHQIVYINESSYTFPANMKIRFQSDSSLSTLKTYFDQIYINVTSYGRIECDFDRLPSTTLTPHIGSYSIGGSGDFDPEYAKFNRTAIDLTGYTTIQLSVWYSYKNTESNDFFGLYYRNNSLWVPIFEITNPTSSGQKPWAQAQLTLPKTLTSLKLQFRWRTTAHSEFMAIDDLLITGVPLGGESNFTGIIDELHIYPTELSPEQCYQDYLCTHTGNTTRSVLVAENLQPGLTWTCFVSPNDSIHDDTTSNENSIILIRSYPGVT
jgi:hypothetical protein